MSNTRSRQGLLDFQDYLARKGLMNPTTARSRKAAAKAVLGILSDDEASDVSKLDLDDVVRRFSNLKGAKFTPGSLKTYMSRTKSAIYDFLRYQENPLTFRVSTPTGSRPARTKKQKPDDSGVNAPAPTQTPNRSSLNIGSPVVMDNVLPIPLRAELTIYVQGLPFDLTPSEANKISKVIMAMAPE